MFKQIRKLYSWILHWAEKPYGPLVLFLLSFSEASFFPIPPDVLLIALSLALRKKAFKFALICSIASSLGGISGYLIGHYLWWDGDAYTVFAAFFFNHIPGFTEQLFMNIHDQYTIHGFMIIFTAGFTPIPYKIFTISAGAFNISFPMFVVASAISRSARFFLLALLIFKFGEKMREFIDRYFNILTLMGTALLIGGYILVHYLIK